MNPILILKQAISKKIDENKYTVKSITSIEEFNRYFKSELSDGEFDTIGGLVMHKFGHLPQKDENISIDGFEFTILRADHRRIRLLSVAKED